MRKLSLPMAMAFMYGMRHRVYNPPDADDKVISPPQSEKSKQYYLRRAEERRLKKCAKRLVIS